MAGKGERAVAVDRLDVAVPVALVPEAAAAAEAGDVLKLVVALDRVPVEISDLAGARELGVLAPRQRLDLVTDGIGGALFAGVLTASTVLKRNAMKDILADV